jgi:hypothetical protein
LGATVCLRPPRTWTRQSWRPRPLAAAWRARYRRRTCHEGLKLDATVTLALIALAVALATLCGWMGARPVNPMKPRMLPYRLLMIVCAAVVVILATHLAGVFGIGKQS